MFQVNEKVVYPGYGIAIINKLVTREVAGSITSFYELKFANQEMSVLVPEHRIGAVGIRRLSTKKILASVIESLKKPITELRLESGLNSWNRRNKKYQLDLRSGDILKLTSVYRDLKKIRHEKELSFGERNLYSKIEILLAEEISAVDGMPKSEALDFLKSSVIYAQKTTISENE